MILTSVGTGVTAVEVAAGSGLPQVLPVAVGVRTAKLLRVVARRTGGYRGAGSDRGAFYGAGSYDGYFGSASVMKLFVATKLLATGQMNGSRARTAYKMIPQSDGGSLEALLPDVGGTDVVPWVESRCGIGDLGTTPYQANCWGNTHISAKGIAYFCRDMMRDKAVAPWLMNALRDHATYGSDGTNMTSARDQARRASA